MEEAGVFLAMRFGHLFVEENSGRKSSMLRAVDDKIASDDETVVCSSASRAEETEAMNQKKPKIRKIGHLRMNAEELSQMRGKIAKAVKVV
jgi:hypothetical protein